jgi:hypothetical protein
MGTEDKKRLVPFLNIPNYGLSHTLIGPLLVNIYVAAQDEKLSGTTSATPDMMWSLLCE